MDIGARELAFFGVQKTELDAAIAATQRDYKNAHARLRTAVRTNARDIVRRGLDLKCRVLRAEQRLLQIRKTSLLNTMRVVQLEMAGRGAEAEALADRDFANATPRILDLQHTMSALQAEVDALHAEIAPETQTE